MNALYVIVRRPKLLRGRRVLQGGSSSILHPVYPLIQQQLMGHQIEPVTLKLLTIYKTKCHSSIHRNNAAIKRRATTSQKQRYTLVKCTYVHSITLPHLLAILISDSKYALFPILVLAWNLHVFGTMNGSNAHGTNWLRTVQFVSQQHYITHILFSITPVCYSRKKWFAWLKPTVV